MKSNRAKPTRPTSKPRRALKDLHTREERAVKAGATNVTDLTITKSVTGSSPTLSTK